MTLISRPRPGMMLSKTIYTYTPHTLYAKGIWTSECLTTMGVNSSRMVSVRVVILVRDMPTQSPLHIGEVLLKYLLELWPAQDLTTKGNNSRMSELSFLFVTHLLNVLYILVRYHGNILKGYSYGLHKVKQLREITPDWSQLVW